MTTTNDDTLPTRLLKLRPDWYMQPEYANPPVIETGLAVQFQDLVRFQSSHFGQFHELIKDEFPAVEDQPRVAHVVEAPHETHVSMPVGQIMLPRVWYRSPDNASVLQLQPDRMAFNWRLQEGGEYPNYREVEPHFTRYLDQFQRFASDRKLGELKPDLCEVVYINRFPRNGRSPREMFEHVLGLSSPFLMESMQGVDFNQTCSIGDIGRFYMEAQIRRDPKADHLTLKMTARLRSDSIEDVRHELRLAHDWVVSGFARHVDADFQWNELGRQQ